MTNAKSKTLACMTVLTLLVSGAAAAQTRDISGIYQMTTAATGPDGKPTCTERWTLGADGRFLIESGQERVQGDWRLAGDAKTGWRMTFTGQTTNGLPDCVGHTFNGPPGEGVQHFYFNVKGDLVLSNPPARNTDGSPLYRPEALLARIGKP